MRLLRAHDLAPLLGSLGLHATGLFVLLFVTRQPVRTQQARPAQPDAWVGDTVEIDAVSDSSSASISTLSNAPSASDGARESATQPEPASVTAKQGAVVRTRAQPAAASRSHAPRRLDPGSAASGAASPGPFGGAGLPPGVRNLASAFTRAIPPATGADPLWQTLPVGPQRPFTIAIEVDAEGHIASAEIRKEKAGSPTEAPAQHVKQRVIALLGGGLFALRGDVGAGRLLFRVAITLSDRAVRDDDAPAELVERGFEPPAEGRPGRAYFTLASGRHFEAKVQVISAK